MKGVLPWLVCCALRAGTRDFCPALAALKWPRTKYFFPLPYTISIHLSPSANQARQAVVPGRLSLNMWLWDVLERAGKVGRLEQKRRLFDIRRVREAVKRSGEAGQQTLYYFYTVSEPGHQAADAAN
jgi:hypothetical protein